MKYLVAYDIHKNKSRKKVSYLLEGIGVRVNLSVFEVELSEAKFKSLVSELENLVDKKRDSLRFYRICENCVHKSFEICERSEIFEDINLYV